MKIAYLLCVSDIPNQYGIDLDVRVSDAFALYHETSISKVPTYSILVTSCPGSADRSTVKVRLPST